MDRKIDYLMFGAGLIVVMMAVLPAFNYLMISSPLDSSISIVSQSSATLAIINGNDGWAHFESGKLVIDFDSVTVGERQIIQFGKDGDPVFQIKNNYDQNMNVSIEVTSSNVPENMQITIYVKNGTTTQSYVIDSNTGAGIIGSFNLNASETADVWIKVQTTGASAQSVTVSLNIRAEVQ
ncbi:hypothetical protein DRO55_02465 [Candidatus Bathyarchaeota archaeon]|nr:MAG: hypothetical protein DRO55_02465 [Candidatus Bathyarchaeota archaeon]